MAELDPRSRYRPLRRLAEGGMGEVWEAVPEDEPDRRVAVKTLLTSTGDDPTLFRKFLEEARIGATLDHPNIVRTLDLGLQDGSLLLAMELLQGWPLSVLYRAELHPLPVGLVLALGIQALEGIAYAHAARLPSGTGVIHRDIKPSNLFLTDSGVLKLIDFGIALAGDRELTATHSGLFRGSILYASPEQIRVEKLDHRTDLYSLAVVLYELLAGKRLFQQPNDAAILSAILWSPPPSIRGLRPDVPKRLDELLATALAKDRTARHASAAELAAALLDAQDAHDRWTIERVQSWAHARLPPLGEERNGRAERVPEKTPPRRRWTDPATSTRPPMPAISLPLAAAAPPAIDDRRPSTHPASRRTGRLVRVAAIAALVIAVIAAVARFAGKDAPQKLDAPKEISASAGAAAAATDARATVAAPEVTAPAVTAPEVATPEVAAPAGATPEVASAPRAARREAPSDREPQRPAPAAPPRVDEPQKPTRRRRADHVETPRSPAPIVQPQGTGWVTIASRPGWAKVTIDGHEAGVTPLYRRALRAGSHEVLAERSDGTKRRKRVEVKPDREHRILFEW